MRSNQPSATTGDDLGATQAGTTQPPAETLHASAAPKAGVRTTHKAGSGATPRARPTGSTRQPTTRSAATSAETLAPSSPGLRSPSSSGTDRTTPTRISGLDQTAIGNDPTHQPGAAHDALPLPRQPHQIGRFTVLRTLGSGGMGVVYAAFDEELDRRVAIKVVRDEVIVGSQGRSRMLREAQAMAKVSHPNVVQVYEVGTFERQVFVAMEFVKGTTLSDWQTAEERTWEETLEMYLQAGRGLAAAHRMGLVHRDFKPDNVLVGVDGRARVLDFGLARAENSRADDDSAVARVSTGSGGNALTTNLTMAGAIMGTPAFMSPEQHLGQPADARSDQFSFAVALFGALYGHPPFAGSTLLELATTVTEGILDPPPSGTTVPAWVWSALRTALQADPNDRHPSMDTLLGALSPEQDAGAHRRWVWPLALVAVATLAVLVTLGVVGQQDPTGEDLAAIERLTDEARDAATRFQWVYPTPADPRDTAYNRVVLLENLAGPAAKPGFDVAHGLRSEFAETLVVLGDSYFDDPISRPYARDYYVQALVFVPDYPRASERSGVTVGQVSDLQQRAGAGDFAAYELVAAEPLRILADPDRVRARGNALAFARDTARGSAIGHERLHEVFRKKGLIRAEELVKPAPAAPPVLVAAAPTEPPIEEPPIEPPPIEPPIEADDDLPARLERERRLKVKPIEDSKVVTPPVVEPAPEPVEEPQSDPDGSRALSDQAAAARRRGATAEAEKLYNQALDLWNGNAAALIGLSDINFERGNFDRAVKYAEKGVRADPTQADYLIRLGDAYFKVFRYSDAQLRYERAAELGHAKAAERLTRVREKLGG